MKLRRQVMGKTLFCIFYCSLLPIFCTNVLAVTDADQAETDNGMEVVFGLGKAIPVRRYDHEQAAITIDGRLDEAAWSGPPLLDRMYVLQPDTLADPPYKTKFRMIYTDRGIYVAFDLEQPADTIIKRFTARDDTKVKRDNVSFTLDTSGEGLYGYWMNLSLGDVQRDGTVKPERRYSKRWDGAWYGSTQLTEKGWSAEFFIPWSQMAMPKVAGVRRIGIYIKRDVTHLKEEWGWPALPKSQPKFLSSLQPLAFDGVDPRQQWSLFPYASVTYDQVDEEFRSKAGFDVFWRPSSNLQLNATINPDFGTVESDNVVVNLTANETFFPEKRLFFLEGQDIFNTTPRADAQFGPKLVIVNTRRIGGPPPVPELPPGEEFTAREELKLAELHAAVKATGQIGSFRYGLLAASEDDTEYYHNDELYLQGGSDFGAFRVLYEDSNGAAYRGLGFISTLVRHPLSDGIVHGIDFHRLSSNGSWDINGQVLYSDLVDEGVGYGAFTDIDYAPSQGLRHSFKFTYYDEKIDINDLGFMRRNDSREGRYSFNRIQSGLSKIRDMESGFVVNYAENSAGYRTTSNVYLWSELTLNNLDSVSASVWYATDRFDDRNSFENGTFEVEAAPGAEIAYRTDAAKKLSVFGKIGYKGEEAGGKSYEVKAGVTWRPRHNVTLDAELKYYANDGWLLHQEDEHFTSFVAAQWQPEISVDYFFTARQHLRLVFEWVGLRAEEDKFYTLEDGGTALIPGPKPPGDTDDFSVSELAFQIRYRWQIAPLSDLYVVYTKGDSRETDLMGFKDLFRDSWRYPLGDQLVVKLRYRLGS